MTSVWAASGGIIALLAVGPTPIYSAPTNSAVLYVLDADETPTSPHSHVYVISSPDGHVIKTYEIGASAQIALAPDGTKLYVSSHISNDAGNTPVPYLDV